MYNLEFINNLNIKYSEIKYSFSDIEYKHYQSKDFKEGKRRGMFTPSYFRREKLMKNASILYGYIYRTNDTYDIDSKFLEAWVIHSPLFKYREDPSLYAKTLQNLNIYLSKNKNLYLKKYNNAINSKYFECHFLRIPKKICGEEELYISYCLITRSLNKDANIGVNCFFINKLVSKEIMIVADDIINRLENKQDEENI